MIVTRSRLHAVRYKRAFDRYLHEQGYEFVTVSELLARAPRE